MLNVKPSPAAPRATPFTDVKKVPSQALLGEAGEIVIVHNGREYRLRITQNGKLILTA